MVSITLSVPDDINQKMDHHSEINWSGFIRKCIEEKAKDLTWQETMLKKLESDAEFEQWSIAMGKKVNKSLAERLKKEKLV